MKKTWDRFMDWMVGDNSTLSLFKALTILMFLPLGSLLGLKIYMDERDRNALENSFDLLDKKPSVIFQTVAQCVDSGYKQADCKKAQDSAIEISHGSGTSIVYYNNDTCVKTHVACKEDIQLIPIYGGGGVATFIPQTTYRPAVVAWQAAANTLTPAVPLYQSAKDGMAWRKDGKLLALEP